jgi:hypothetical protein
MRQFVMISFTKIPVSDRWRFRTVSAIKKSSKEELANAAGTNMSKLIYNHFNTKDQRFDVF